MGRGGISDILIANPLVGPRRMERLVELRKVSGVVAVHRDGGE